MSHVAVRFGPANALVGVVTTPTESRRTRRKTGVLILNAGVVHRAGPNRLHTSLAIRLSHHGFTVLRFDYSGIGDSDRNPEHGSLIARNLRETQAAMNWLGREYGIEDFIVVGLCSGADNAVRVAAADARIIGLGLLDGYAYHTPASRRLTRGETRRKLTSVSGLARVFSRLCKKLLFANRGKTDAGTLGLMLKPPQADAEGELLALVNRGVQLLCVYTPELGVYKYADQFFDFFPTLVAADRVRIEFFEQADHIFTQQRHQLALSDVMAAWAMESCV